MEPLSQQHKENLVKHWALIVKNMIPEGIMSTLVSHGVLSQREMETIKSYVTTDEKNEQVNEQSVWNS